MDPQVWIRSRISANRPEMEWKPGSREETLAWQRKLRRRLAELIGISRFERTPIKATLHDRREMRGYTRETVRFESLPGLELFGYFLLPSDRPAKLPVVICLPGHGRGVDSCVGITENGSQRELGAPAEYQADFPLQCVAHGYAAFAIEQVSFGYRCDAKAAKQGKGASSCVRDSMAALMLGESMTGWRVWDAMRAIDYVLTRREIDPKRVATMGISGGGLTSLFAACVDTRVKAAVVSGYLNTFAGSILSVDHCPDNYVPGLLRLVEMPDMAGLVAPRALFAESGSDDPIFPRTSFESAVERIKAIYGSIGSSDSFGSTLFKGDHRFDGKAAFQWLQARL